MPNSPVRQNVRVRTRRKVAICIPHNGQWRAGFGISLCSLLMATREAAPEIELTVIGHEGSSVAVGRDKLVRRAIDPDDLNATEILFIDSDQVFPADGLLRLLNHDREIVLAGYWCSALVRSGLTLFDLDRQRIELRAGDSGLRQILSAGLGFCLIRAETLRRIPQPRFQMPWHPESDTVIGEDGWFFMRAAELGIEAWADLDLTRQMGHIGSVIYGMGPDGELALG